jgi:hypothetical protein
MYSAFDTAHCSKINTIISFKSSAKLAPTLSPSYKSPHP